MQCEKAAKEGQLAVALASVKDFKADLEALEAERGRLSDNLQARGRIIVLSASSCGRGQHVLQWLCLSQGIRTLHSTCNISKFDCLIRL